MASVAIGRNWCVSDNPERPSFECDFPTLCEQWDSYMDVKVEQWQNSHSGISWLQSHVGFTFHSVAHDVDFSWHVIHSRCCLCLQFDLRPKASPLQA